MTTPKRRTAAARLRALALHGYDRQSAALADALVATLRGQRVRSALHATAAALYALGAAVAHQRAEALDPTPPAPPARIVTIVRPTGGRPN